MNFAAEMCKRQRECVILHTIRSHYEIVIEEE